MSSERPADRSGTASAEPTRPRSDPAGSPASTNSASTNAGSADPGQASPTTPVRPRRPVDDGSPATPGDRRPQVSDDSDTDTDSDTGARTEFRPDPLAAAEEAIDSRTARGRSERSAGDAGDAGGAGSGSGQRGKYPGGGDGPRKGKGWKGQGRKGAGKQGLPTRARFKVLQGLGPTEPRPELPDQSHLPAEQRADLAVRVQHLRVNYRTSFEKKPTLRQAVLRMGRGQRAVREVQALKDVSFEVRTGTSMGIIGRNGAGKSTLMRAMAGILPPTSGTVEVWGRASTLLALGVGFNNSLSGRENIILGGLASGLSRAEVEERADEIADWTELGEFIDMPMRTYSSGMFARVAFSVAVHMEPDILMIDEALSTGDAHFREKASEKMAELRSRARAMFLVSHGLGSIKELCNEAIWIEKGRLMKRGEPDEVVDAYLEYVNARRSSTTLEDV